MKVYARAYARLSLLADAIQWLGAADYFRAEAANMSDLINAKITPEEYTSNLNAYYPTWEKASAPIVRRGSFSNDIRGACEIIAAQVIGGAKLHASESS
jgi:hypothetical protein